MVHSGMLSREREGNGRMCDIYGLEERAHHNPSDPCMRTDQLVYYNRYRDKNIEEIRN